MLGGRLSVAPGEGPVLRSRVVLEPLRPQAVQNVQRQVRTIARAAAKMQKHVLKAGAKQPSEVFSAAPCCTRLQCSEQHRDVDIYRLRKYFTGLSDSNQRDFVKQRTKLATAFEDIEQDVDMTGRRMYRMVLETPERLKHVLDKLESPKSHGHMLPLPTRDTQRVCKKFFLCAIQRSRNWAYPHCAPGNARPRAKWVAPGSRTTLARDFPLTPEAKTIMRDSPKTASVLSWFHEQAELHCMLPNASGTVLPFSTKHAAHAMYVMDEEGRANFEHCERSNEIYDNLQMVADESVDEHSLLRAAELHDRLAGQQIDGELDELSRGPEESSGEGDGARQETHIRRPRPGEAVEVEHCRERLKKSIYRYGNPLLGTTDQLAEAAGMHIASYTTFANLWRHSEHPRAHGHPDAPILKLRAWLPFAKCDQCMEHRSKKAGEKDPAARKVLDEEQRAHINFVKRERLSYRLRQLESISSNQYLSMIVDGADQAKYAMPYTCSKSHTSDAKWKVKMHLLGVIAHGYGAYVFTCPPNFAQGHNVTIQAIFEVLEEIKKEHNLVSLPETLYLQLDNTTKQNKGKWLMAFLALLVEAGTFRKIIVSFLPVGHTHEDIDQFFSRIAVVLRKKDAHSRVDLARIISKLSASSAFWGKVRLVRHWENVANVSGWLKGKVHKMPTITKWQQFKLCKDPDTARVLLMAREWPGDKGDYWGGLTSNQTDQPIWSCADVPNLLLEYADGQPTKPPSQEKIDKTNEDVLALMDHLRVSDESRADTVRLLEVFSTPARDLDFAWSRDHIESLLGGTNRNFVSGAAGSGNNANAVQDEWRVSNECTIVENCFYLMMPPAGALEPFWIAKARKRVIQDGEKMVHIQYWEPLTEARKPALERDYFRCEYGAAASCPSSMPVSKLPIVGIEEGFIAPLTFKVTSGKGIGKLVAGRKEENFNHIKWYIARWKAGSVMNLEPDEGMPAHLMPEGRIDIPAERVRKPSKKRKSASTSPIQDAPSTKKARNAQDPSAASSKKRKRTASPPHQLEKQSRNRN